VDEREAEQAGRLAFGGKIRMPYSASAGKIRMPYLASAGKIRMPEQRAGKIGMLRWRSQGRSGVPG
jgi:hypothetical protein